MLAKVKIYGERCSGTNYLKQLLITNFNVQIVCNPPDKYFECTGVQYGNPDKCVDEVTHIYNENCTNCDSCRLNSQELNILKTRRTYGHKHFFGFNDFSDSDDILFIGIIRNLPDYINSLYRDKHHLPEELTNSIDSFLNNEFYSINPIKVEIMNDRNIETYNRYKNIFEMRHIKNKFLVETMPKSVKNYILITYDDLVNDHINIMNKFKIYLPVKNDIIFPQNISYYKDLKNVIYKKKDNNIIPTDIIMTKANLYYEKILFPKMCFQ